MSAFAPLLEPKVNEFKHADRIHQACFPHIQNTPATGDNVGKKQNGKAAPWNNYSGLPLFWRT
jgi:hypothetical protein